MLSVCSVTITVGASKRRAMTIPDYQTLMRPVLELHADGAEHVAKDVVAAMSDLFGLTSEERAQLLPSGKQTTIANRVTWAATYLTHAGALERPRRAVTVITERGKDLAAGAGQVNVKALEQFPEFVAFRARTGTRSSSGEPASPKVPEVSPSEAIPALVAETHAVLAADVVDRVRRASPEFFEHCVLQLLVKMGYGGAAGDSEHLGGPGDGGFDGLVRKDSLGFDVVYTQAKRYAADHLVGSQEVQSFVGALHGKHADRGVFITTSAFSKAALEYAKTVPTRIVLIDGQRLGELVVNYGCGVRDAETIAARRGSCGPYRRRS
jgi:restriction system protein